MLIIWKRTYIVVVDFTIFTESESSDNKELLL